MTNKPEPTNELLPPERIRVHSSVLFQTDEDGEPFIAEYISTEEEDGTGFVVEYARTPTLVKPEAEQGHCECACLNTNWRYSVTSRRHGNQYLEHRAGAGRKRD